MGERRTTSTTTTATRKGTTHNHSLARGSPVAGSRGVLSRSLCLRVAQRRLPSSRRTMIMERTNNQTNPSVSSTTLVTPNSRGSDSKSGASSGKAIQPRMPIGIAASAQMPTILAREYCSLGLSLEVLCAMDSPSTPPGVLCTCALRNYPNLTVLLSPRQGIPFHHKHDAIFRSLVGTSENTVNTKFAEFPFHALR
jgi:hypothetical protein